LEAGPRSAPPARRGKIHSRHPRIRQIAIPLFLPPEHSPPASPSGRISRFAISRSMRSPAAARPSPTQWILGAFSSPCSKNPRHKAGSEKIDQPAKKTEMTNGDTFRVPRSLSRNAGVAMPDSPPCRNPIIVPVRGSVRRPVALRVASFASSKRLAPPRHPSQKMMEIVDLARSSAPSTGRV